MIPALIFAAALHLAPAWYDHRPAGAPIEYGLAVWVAARHHDVDPWTSGAILLAENRSREWADTAQVGRYGATPRELGLYQLVPELAREAEERCNHRGQRYDPGATRSKAPPGGLPDCLWIAPGARVDRAQALQNIEAAQIAFAYLASRRREWRTWYSEQPATWVAMFRCAPGAWQLPQRAVGGAPWSALGMSRRCYWSVGRVFRWRKIIIATATGRGGGS